MNSTLVRRKTNAYPPKTDSQQRRSGEAVRPRKKKTKRDENR